MRYVLVFAVGLMMAGCGTQPPEIEEFYEREPWKEVSINDNLELNIKKKVFCELVEAIRSTEDLTLEYPDGRVIPALPHNYGVQMQLTLTVEEAGSLNPSIGITDPKPAEFFNGISVPQSVALNLNGVMSSVASRTDISYAYYNVETISGRDKHGGFTVKDEHGKRVNAWCDEFNAHGSSRLIVSDLGLSKWLRKTVFAASQLHSSAPKMAAKDSKLDIFTYGVKFVVVTSVGINPVIRIAKVATGTGNQPLVGLGRTRTHDLTLTFGPGAGSPIAAALATHFTGQGQPLAVVPGSR